jgi:hypothetical protein
MLFENEQELFGGDVVGGIGLVEGWRSSWWRIVGGEMVGWLADFWCNFFKKIHYTTYPLHHQLFPHSTTNCFFFFLEHKADELFKNQFSAQFYFTLIMTINQ